MYVFSQDAADVMHWLPKHPRHQSRCIPSAVSICRVQIEYLLRPRLRHGLTGSDTKGRWRRLSEGPSQYALVPSKRLLHFPLQWRTWQIGTPLSPYPEDHLPTSVQLSGLDPSDMCLTTECQKLLLFFKRQKTWVSQGGFHRCHCSIFICSREHACRHELTIQP